MKNLILVLICFILMANTCGKKDSNCPEGAHNGISFYNNSYTPLIFEIYWNHPDTVIGSYNPTGSGTIKPGESLPRGAGPRSCWESVLKDGKKEYIYIFDEDSLQVIPWEVVRATNRGLLERREIDLKYLQANNFIVTYP